jgi:hypothetical protein
VRFNEILKHHISWNLGKIEYSDYFLNILCTIFQNFNFESKYLVVSKSIQPLNIDCTSFCVMDSYHLLRSLIFLFILFLSFSIRVNRWNWKAGYISNSPGSKIFIWGVWVMETDQLFLKWKYHILFTLCQSCKKSKQIRSVLMKNYFWIPKRFVIAGNIRKNPRTSTIYPR